MMPWVCCNAEYRFETYCNSAKISLTLACLQFITQLFNRLENLRRTWWNCCALSKISKRLSDRNWIYGRTNVSDGWVKDAFWRDHSYCNNPHGDDYRLQQLVLTLALALALARFHDDVIKWKHFPRYWSFVQEIHRSPVNSPHKGQWCGALMFSLICVLINSWENNREAGDLRRFSAHYDVIVMSWDVSSFWSCSCLKLYTDNPSFNSLWLILPIQSGVSGHY